MWSARWAEALASGVTYYVDANSGSDEARGTSPREAWRTLARVNRTRLMPGDQVLLHRGQGWRENLRPVGAGTAERPIRIGPYGPGALPVIDGGGVGPALALLDQEGWVIEGLALTSPGQAGLVIDSTGHRRTFFRVKNVEVYDSRQGIEIGRPKGGTEANAGYLQDVVVEGCVVRNMSHRGIVAAGNYGPPALPRNRDLVFARCHVSECGWDGIMMTSTSGGLITDCVAHDCGLAADARYGIWAWWADHITIQKSEAYRIRTIGSKDGGGFDLDWGTSDCVIQYCHAHDNDGPGFAMISNRAEAGNTSLRNIVRYNMSHDNCRKTSTRPHGELLLFGGMDHASVYNNTIRWKRRTPNFAALTLSGWWREDNDWPRGTVIRNLVIVAETGCRVLRVDEECTRGERGNSLDYNLYYSMGPDLRIRWGGSEFSTLAAWSRASAQERHGLSEDPRLIDVELRPDSPCIDRGVMLPKHSTLDYRGNPVPRGQAPDLGASEFVG